MADAEHLAPPRKGVLALEAGPHVKGEAEGAAHEGLGLPPVERLPFDVEGEPVIRAQLQAEAMAIHVLAMLRVVPEAAQGHAGFEIPGEIGHEDRGFVVEPGERLFIAIEAQ